VVISYSINYKSYQLTHTHRIFSARTSTGSGSTTSSRDTSGGAGNFLCCSISV